MSLLNLLYSSIFLTEKTTVRGYAAEMPMKYHQRAEISALVRAGDPKFLHLGLKSGPFHPEFNGRAGGPADDPLGRLERAQDVITLCRFKCGDRLDPLPCL